MANGGGGSSSRAGRGGAANGAWQRRATAATAIHAERWKLSSSYCLIIAARRSDKFLVEGIAAGKRGTKLVNWGSVLLVITAELKWKSIRHYA
jgi:hypothetical protein